MSEVSTTSSVSKPKTIRQTHITSYLEIDLTFEAAAERRRKIFEQEEKRDRERLEAARRKQQAIEDEWLERLQKANDDRLRPEYEREKARLAAECELIERRRQDRATNDVGKLVVDRVYIGSVEAAKNGAWLHASQVRAVVNVTPNHENFFEHVAPTTTSSSTSSTIAATTTSTVDNSTTTTTSATTTETPQPVTATAPLKYLNIRIEDRMDEDATIHFATSADWIHSQLENGGVLIHCQEGICRSATFVVAYLMQKRRMTLQEANETVARARPLMSINSGFQLQLQRLEEQLFPDIVERRKRELIEAQQKLEQERAQAAEAAAAARSASIKKRRISADVSLNNVISSATANDTNNGIETADNADSNPALTRRVSLRAKREVNYADSAIGNDDDDYLLAMSEDNGKSSTITTNARKRSRKASSSSVIAAAVKKSSLTASKEGNSNNKTTSSTTTTVATTTTLTTNDTSTTTSSITVAATPTTIVDDEKPNASSANEQQSTETDAAKPIRKSFSFDQWKKK